MFHSIGRVNMKKILNLGAVSGKQPPVIIATLSSYIQLAIATGDGRSPDEICDLLYRAIAEGQGIVWSEISA